MSGLWEQPGVPHKGWRCVGVTDVCEDDPGAYTSCQMCGQERVRYVHTMEHVDHDTLDVGCVCAEKMENDYAAPKAREVTVRNRTARRATWLTRSWRLSKNGNWFLNVEGRNVGIMLSKFHAGKWCFRVEKNFDRRVFDSSDEAKLGLFDALFPKPNWG